MERDLVTSHEVPSGVTPEGEASRNPVPPPGGFSRPPRDGLDGEYWRGFRNGYAEGRDAEANGETIPDWMPPEGGQPPAQDGGQADG